MRATPVLRHAPLVAVLACTPVAPEPAQNEIAAPGEPTAAAHSVAEPQTAVAPTIPTLALVPVVRSRSPLRLFETTDGSLFVTANAQAIRVPDSGPLERDPRFIDGIADPGMLEMTEWRAAMLGGSWPDALHLVVDVAVQRRSARPEVYRFTDAAWSRIANVEGLVAWSYPAITPWTDGTMLTVRSHVSADGEYAKRSFERMKATDRAIAIAAPREFESIDGKGTNVPSFGERRILGFASLASGDAVAIGDQSMLFWGRGNRKPSKVRLARPVVAEAQVVMRSANDVWLIDGAGMQHFDGSAWAVVDTPQTNAVISFAIDDDGRQWLVHGSSARYQADDNAIYERDPGGAWTELELPMLPFPADAQPQFDHWTGMHDPVPDAGAGETKLSFVPMQVLARAEGLWLVARGPEFGIVGDYRWALLHTHDRGAVLEVPEPEEMRRELVDRRPEVPFLGRKDCDVFVPIAVDDIAGDHRSLRDELGEIALPAKASMVLLEVVRDGKPAIGVAIPARHGKRAAKRIVAALKRPLGPRMGKPICQPMIGKRSLEQWGEDGSAI